LDSADSLAPNRPGPTSAKGLTMVCFAMPRKPKPPPDDAQQSKRSIETARERKTDESQEAFDKAFKKIVPPKAASRKPSPR
jgi:hypothetical protein